MSPSHSPQHLSPGTAHSLSIRARTVLRVVRGRLWVTVAGDLTDYFVPAGEALELPHGAVVIEADQGVRASYELHPPERCAVRTGERPGAVPGGTQVYALR